MRLNPVTKGAVAVATALCLFLALATPASANPFPLTITAGTVTAAGNNFHGHGPGPCTLKSSLQVAFPPVTAAGTTRLSGGWSTNFQLGTPPSGQWYQGDFSILNAGTAQLTYALSSAGPPTWSYNLATIAANRPILQLRIYRVPTCDKTDLACIVNVMLSYTGTLTSATALPFYAPGGITLNGASVAPHMMVASCNPPFTSWAGQTMTFTGWTMI
ncbi:MAG TPA: hypothetical protein VK507_02145 [Iamia sp.]|nr:hypothetical protein [Iamia sp.]